MKRVHAMADCRNCDWHCGDFQTADREGREHSRQTGHVVVVELGLAQHYVGGRAQLK
jgi:hypothetical protein